MKHLIPSTGLLAAISGVAWLIPAIAARMERGAFAAQDYAVASVGLLLLVSGAVAIWSLSGLCLASVPPPVRAAVMGNGLLIAFCVLEFSDGLLRQNGRVFYWTSVLFLPALALFYGQVLAHRWAWWAARILTALCALWFVTFLLMIPFVHLRGHDGAIPWWGRIYAAAVTLAFASVSAYVFRSLGRTETRTYYGISPRL
jgi:lysylphosphatidylglycerol synthetase-like protein (DUF2156 family)